MNSSYKCLIQNENEPTIVLEILCWICLFKYWFKAPHIIIYLEPSINLSESQ
jgi:hypothetical protein